MTVSAGYAPPLYVVNGAGPYAFDFPLVAAEDIVVLREDLTVLPVTEYTVAVFGDTPIYSSATVTLDNPVDPPQTQDMTIQRVTTLSQELNLLAYGPFPAESVEGALDKLTMVQQEAVANV